MRVKLQSEYNIDLPSSNQEHKMIKEAKLSLFPTYIIIVFLLSLSILLSACGSNTNNTTPTTGATDFSDMPEYPGATRDELEEIDFGIEPLISPQSYSRSEWRYYTTSDDKNKVAEHYQKEMVSNKSKWKQGAWANVGDKVSWGIFTKETGQRDPIAWVVLNSTDSGTRFALIRATGNLQ